MRNRLLHENVGMGSRMKTWLSDGGKWVVEGDAAVYGGYVEGIDEGISMKKKTRWTGEKGIRSIT